MKSPTLSEQNIRVHLTKIQYKTFREIAIDWTEKFPVKNHFDNQDNSTQHSLQQISQKFHTCLQIIQK
jgi:hypothetical protein